MEYDLKPCPFCGYSKIHFACDFDGTPSGIVCHNCHIIIRYSRIHTKGSEPFGVAMGKMAEAWNRRAQ